MFTFFFFTEALDSSAQTGHVGVIDWQEEIYQKVYYIKLEFFSCFSFLFYLDFSIMEELIKLIGLYEVGDVLKDKSIHSWSDAEHVEYQSSIQCKYWYFYIL